MGESGVQITAGEAVILEQLVRCRREMFGLEIVDASKGAIARGSVYVLLSRMTEKGLVESRLEERDPRASGLPRRLYKPTGVGERVLRAWQRLQTAGAPRLALTLALADVWSGS